eukprot:1061906-Amphidinium_carterae.1
MGRRGGSTMPCGVDKTAQRSTEKSYACAMHSSPLCTPDYYGSRLSVKAWTSMPTAVRWLVAGKICQMPTARFRVAHNTSGTRLWL